MYLGFWRPVALKPAPLLGVGRKCALELSNSGLLLRNIDELVLDLLRAGDITVVSLVPTMLQRLLEAHDTIDSRW